VPQKDNSIKAWWERQPFAVQILIAFSAIMGAALALLALLVYLLLGTELKLDA
jgi:hypothetical protein